MQEQRFTDLWQRLGGGHGQATQAFAEVQSRYAAPGRRYHSPRHIDQCLRQLDAALVGATTKEIHKPDQVELALWFHDAVYHPKARDNEHRSAQLFLTLAEDLACSTRQSVFELIMATVHPNEPEHPDHQAVVDIDLSSFGLPWTEFLRDSRDVRAEYGHLSHEVFMCGQNSFLGRLMSRRRFYLTPFFHQRLEQRARDNIRRYLELMQAGPTRH